MTRPLRLPLAALLLTVSLSGCATSPTALTPKQRLTVATDTFTVAETAITAGVRAGAITPEQNTKLIRPVVLTVRSLLERATIALSKTPPDSGWQQFLDGVDAALPAVLQFARLAQMKQ